MDRARNGSADPAGPTLVQEFNDVEVLRKAAAGAGWSVEYQQLGAGPLRVRSVAVQCADILVIAQRADQSLEVVGLPPPGMLTVMISAAGDDFRVNGYSIRDTDLIVLAPGREMYAVTRSAVAVCAVHIPDSRFEAGTSSSESRRESLERGWVIPVPAGELGLLRELLNAADALPSRGARIASILTSELIPLIRQSNNVAATRDRYGRAHRWQVLRRARAYIDNHLGETVRMVDLCRHAGASSRTVERVFKQELQMTPSAYIRVRRLNAVKRELVGQGAADRSITEIAMSFGFGHLGRFSGAYREHFGHSPSEALKKLAGL